ncbi:SusD/RagB family nutrient-binding outer membrane lipoprotein [Rhodohalobacter sp. 614A]|uniref:SusD/RagB family nutrient-binding outer membrane lipoprotein n=1 Tax=Rhodohalobacter sp. 614A TaxID=2908649 RepID=UPI001F2A5472|nr:SusD/RagB family nutrient-binding outer membrane lipoprotein [Rhodohalobacter sp. 614A]
MTLLKKAALMLAVFGLVMGCDDFGNLNVDSNNPSEVRTDLLLTNAEREISDVVGATTGVIWTQLMAETQYEDDSRYSSATFDFNSWYYGPLKDLQTIIEENSNEDTMQEAAAAGSNANQIAAARILQVYFYHMMTDRWGAIPYSEALQGRENFSPSYDSQESIYMDLLKELNEAVSQMDSGPGPTGDIVFDGEMTSWALFANSLRARIALRMADVNPDVAAQEFTDAVNDGLITEDVMYPYLADADNENPWYGRFRTRTDYAISDVLANYMLNLDDYRVLKYANPAPVASNNDGQVTFDEIIGMDYDSPNPGDILNSSISFPGSAIGAGGPGVGIQNAPLPIITLAELNFAKAEAVERGWISGSAEEYYNAAIEASWMQWEVYNETNFTAFISQPEVAYSSADWKEKIGNQKWVAFYPNGYQAWAEWRRLDYPELEPHDRALSPDNEIPVRHMYPSSEEEINTENYEAAISANGADTPSRHLWWDVN